MAEQGGRRPPEKRTLPPTAARLDEFTKLGHRVFDRLRGHRLPDIEALKGESARPFAMDIMKMMTIGHQLLEQWGFDAELPENVIPEAELEARRARKIRQ